MAVKLTSDEIEHIKGAINLNIQSCTRQQSAKATPSTVKEAYKIKQRQLEALFAKLDGQTSLEV